MTTAPPTDPPRDVALPLILGAIASTLLLVAALFLPTPALVDCPNHLARIFILKNWDGNSYLQEFYRINWACCPISASTWPDSPSPACCPSSLPGRPPWPDDPVDRLWRRRAERCGA